VWNSNGSGRQYSGPSGPSAGTVPHTAGRGEVNFKRARAKFKIPLAERVRGSADETRRPILGSVFVHTLPRCRSSSLPSSQLSQSSLQPLSTSSSESSSSSPSVCIVIDSTIAVVQFHLRMSIHSANSVPFSTDFLSSAGHLVLKAYAPCPEAFEHKYSVVRDPSNAGLLPNRGPRFTPAGTHLKKSSKLP
jgi:hypothetical protein